MISDCYRPFLLFLLALPLHAQRVENVLSPYRAEVDRRVNRGLDYLASVQTKEGYFLGKYGNTTGVVSLAGMAFLAKGHTPGYGPYGDAINRCIDYVLGMQKKNGLVAGRHSHGPMYSHSIATLFLSEVSGMVDPERQEKIDQVLGKAIRVLLAAQSVTKSSRHQGGWRYQPNSKDSDLSLSGWALMALRSAKLNGAQVPDKAIEDAVKYIFKVHDPRNGRFGYQSGASHPVNLTGAALLCLELTGHHGEDVTFKAGDYILKIKNQQSSYGLYYAAQATFQLGGKYWEQYATWMYGKRMAGQKEDGSWHGSWGASYETATRILAFTVPYRQLPIYQRDETVDEED
ncbi:MAG: terpene cyclase/mutase family protein [Planctomycetota bacterium]|nr:terpene cyclase/mutase family protein [Planctomycetota bacterium]